jgi:O-antigen/teichoic acid export membrane protein
VRLDALYRRVLSGASWSLSGAVLSRGLTLISLIVVARAISPSRFGELTVIQTTAALMSALAGLGLGMAATKRVAEIRQEDRAIAGRTIGAALVVTGCAGVVLSFALLLLAGPISGGLLNAPSLTNEVRLAAPLALAGSLAAAQLGILYGLEAFKEMFLSSVVRAAAISLMLVGGAYRAGVPGALLGLVGGEFVGTAFTHVMLRRSAARQGIVISYRARLRDVRALSGLAAPASVASIALQLAIWFGQIVLLRQADGFSQAALFNLAYRWYLVIMFFPSSVSPIALPLLANVRASNKREDYSRLARLTLIGNVLVVAGPAIVVGAVAPVIMRLGGTAYEAGWPALLILAGAAVPSALNNALSQTALSLNKIREWLLSDIVLAASLALFALILVPRLRATGLAAAYLGAMLMTCVVLFGPVRKGLAQLK